MVLRDRLRKLAPAHYEFAVIDTARAADGGGAPRPPAKRSRIAEATDAFT